MAETNHYTYDYEAQKHLEKYLLTIYPWTMTNSYLNGMKGNDFKKLIGKKGSVSRNSNNWRVISSLLQKL